MLTFYSVGVSIIFCSSTYTVMLIIQENRAVAGHIFRCKAAKLLVMNKEVIGSDLLDLHYWLHVN